VRWVEKLSDNETPAWLGLPKNAEILRLKNYGKKALTKLLKMQTVEEDSAIELSFVENEETKEQQQQQQQSSMLRPLWIRSLEQNCLKWLELLPQVFEFTTTLFFQTNDTIPSLTKSHVFIVVIRFCVG
jgi:dynein heavy chain 1